MREVAAGVLASAVLPVKRIASGADITYHTRGLLEACRDANVTTHVPQNTNRVSSSAIDERTTRHAGYAVSERMRKWVEWRFCLGKPIGLMRQVIARVLDEVDQLLAPRMAADNLPRLRSLAQLRQRCA
jgi:hypothetical protein